MIAVTGSRNGLTQRQADMALRLLWMFREKDLYGGVLGHGDCVGADERLHAMAMGLGYGTAAFPPFEEKWRAWCKATVVHRPEVYLVRDRALVDAAELLLAFPSDTEKAQPRSGTWATVRYARRRGVQVVVIEP